MCYKIEVRHQHSLGPDSAGLELSPAFAGEHPYWNVWSDEPPFLVRGTQQTARYEQLRHKESHLKHLTGKTDQYIRIGKLTYKVGDGCGRANQVEPNHRQDVVTKKDWEVSSINLVAAPFGIRFFVTQTIRYNIHAKIPLLSEHRIAALPYDSV